MNRDREINWLSDAADQGFGDLRHEMDFLHKAEEGASHSTSETYWLQFSIPEAKINGEIYIWVHSALNMTSGGVWIWQGIKRHQLLAESFDFQAFMPYPTVDGHSVSIPKIGLTLNIIQPLQSMSVEYQSVDHSTTLQLTATGLMDPIMRADNMHFEQPMRVVGTLKLGGKTYAVDCFGFRDRSWGQHRPESPMKYPPIGWSATVLGDGQTAFNFVATDDPTRNPEWSGVYEVSSQDTLKNGWIFRNGSLRRLRKISKRTERAPSEWMRPINVECTLEDETGERHELRATCEACLPFSMWPSLLANFAQMRWVLDDGLVGYGDLQDFFWTDYAKRFCR
jgi:hypothetical protein